VQVQPAIELALSHPGPVLIDFQVEEYENTYPMVPPATALRDTVDSPYKPEDAGPRVKIQTGEPATAGRR
jgi:hypothetical protein